MQLLFTSFRRVCAASAVVILAPALLAAQDQAKAANETGKPARMNCGVSIECIGPDGQLVRVAPWGQNDTTAAVLIMDDDTVSCQLAEGDTTFIVALPRASTIDHLIFINKNMAARGELKIAVATEAPQSGRWTPVGGSLAFAHKRLFNLSMLGVEAKFVRLTFSVEREGRIAGMPLYGDRAVDDFAASSAASSALKLSPTNNIELLLGSNARLFAETGSFHFSSTGW